MLAQSTSLVPLPEFYQEGVGEFVFNSKTKVAYPKDDSIKMIVDNFVDNFKSASGILLSTSNKKGDIELTVNRNFEDEEYKLNVTPTKIFIEAAKPVGFFYAFQTLKQMLPAAVMAGKRDN